MKKILLASLSLIALTSTLASAAFVVRTATASTAAASADVTAANRAAAALHLSPDLIIPSALPAAIQDPTLLEAWIRLYNHQDPIQLWDGGTLTGRGLAEYLLAHGIPVVWDTDNVCGGGSCSVKSCATGQDVCSYENGQSAPQGGEVPSVAPIYVRTGERGDMLALVATLAHEIFHRTQPFGAVADTRFEEYWAFRIECHITAEAWLTFGAYDPLDPNHLNMWIRDNRLDPYFQLPEYPPSVEPLVIRPIQGTGGAFEGLPAEAMGTGQGNAK